MSQDVKPRIPKIGEYVRGHGTLVSIQDITPIVNKQDGYIFEYYNATYELRINGKVVSQGNTYNDFYGLETCLETAVGDAKEVAKELSVNSDVEVVVVKITGYSCKIPGIDKNFYDDKFKGFRGTENGHLADVPESKYEDYWSSKRGLLVHEG